MPDLPDGIRPRSEVEIGDLLARHLPSLRAYVRLQVGPLLRRRESESDIVQAVCVEVLRNDRFEYRGEPQFRAWLHRAVLNCIRDRERHYKVQRRGGAHDESFDESSLVASYSRLATPSEILSAREHVECLERAFDRLPRRDVEALTLVYIAEVERSEAARVLGVTPGHLATLLLRARVRLARALCEAE